MKSVLREGSENFLPSISVDCVVFGFHDGNLKILLNRFSECPKWMLPGGFIYNNEDVDKAAFRILSERTGLSEIHLRQFYLFGKANRTNIEENIFLLEKYDIPLEERGVKHWLLQRFASMGYYALVEYSKLNIQTTYEEEIQWFSIDEIPELYSDHNEVIRKALQTLRINLGHLPLGFQLLPEKFMMSELRIIYETILGEPLDRRNFEKKILSTGFVEKTDEICKKWGVKSSRLFTFNREKYEKALQDGFFLLG